METRADTGDGEIFAPTTRQPLRQAVRGAGEPVVEAPENTTVIPRDSALHPGSGLRRARRTAGPGVKPLGLGLVEIPELAVGDPEWAVLRDARVPQRRRVCARCEARLEGEEGVCGRCGAPYRLRPTLFVGEVLAGQYEVRGPIAFGGMGWIYLAYDGLLSRYVVLKGLLNAADEGAAAVALAERRFLAAVKHPNIVGIYNVVRQDADAFLVMEYVGGRTLRQIRQERGPLPPAEAMAYVHRILPALGYLHRRGLVYCDLKPDNLMLERDDLRLIDLGGTRRVDDLEGDLYGTVGYAAPEAGEGPTPLSDLYTAGRTLLVLLTEARGFATTFRYALPRPEEEPLFARYDSLYRFLRKATAREPDDRFQDAEEMAEQLLGVMRQVVAAETGVPRPGVSRWFGAVEMEAGAALEAVAAEMGQVPALAVQAGDPAAGGVMVALAAGERKGRIEALRRIAEAQPASREVGLRLAAELMREGQAQEAGWLLEQLGKDDPWDWRVAWIEAEMDLLADRAPEAAAKLEWVVGELPGELAPRLALGQALERMGKDREAEAMYAPVAWTDAGMAAAVFGLSRVRGRMGNRTGAVEALEEIPAGASLYGRARVGMVRMLLGGEAGDIAQASRVVMEMGLEEAVRLRLTGEVLEAALRWVLREGEAAAGERVFGCGFRERALRLALEENLRERARGTAGAERTELLEEANRVRPRTLF